MLYRLVYRTPYSIRKQTSTKHKLINERSMIETAIYADAITCVIVERTQCSISVVSVVGLLLFADNTILKIKLIHLK